MTVGGGINSLEFTRAIAAAFAIRNDAVLMHKDPEFDALTGLLPMEALPYKKNFDNKA